MRDQGNHCRQRPEQTNIRPTVVHGLEEQVSITQPLSRDEVLRGMRIQHVAYVQVVDTPEGVPQDYRIDERGITVGRSPDCAIQLLVANVSRVHARFISCNEECYVEDLDSTNGTYVNGTRVVRCVLRNSDHIQIGETTLVFVEERVREQP